MKQRMGLVVVLGLTTALSAAAAPPDVGGLTCWLRADSILGLQDGDLIMFWPDQSGQHHNFSQADGNFRPTWYSATSDNGLNGCPTVRFNGWGNYFAADDFMDFSSMTLFVVAKSYSPDRYLFTSYGDPAIKKVVMTTGNSETFVARSTGPAQMTVNFTDPFLNSFQIGELVLDASAQTLNAKIIHTDGTSASGSDYNAAYVADTFEGGGPPTLGAYNDGSSVNSYFDGCVAEFIIYNRALSAAEIAQVEDYLHQRYFAPAPVTVQGTVAMQGFAGSYATAGVSVEFRPAGAAPAFTRSAMLDNTGTFTLDEIPVGDYTVTVKNNASLRVVLENVTVAANPTVLTGPIALEGGDTNGDNRVSFEDFSILQNTYGDSGAATAGPLAAAATGGCTPVGLLLISILALALRCRD